jgi:hypothetical protein
MKRNKRKDVAHRLRRSTLEWTKKLRTECLYNHPVLETFEEPMQGNAIVYDISIPTTRKASSVDGFDSVSLI